MSEKLQKKYVYITKNICQNYCKAEENKYKNYVYKRFFVPSSESVLKSEIYKILSNSFILVNIDYGLFSL